MTLLAHRGDGPSFPYAGQPMHILAGHDGQPAGSAAMEITVPPYFAGPIWAPAKLALAFMEEVGAALTPRSPPDPGHMREIYAGRW